MAAQEMLALALVLSIAAAVVAWAAGSLIERTSRDPRLRDTVWGAGLALSAMPPVAVAVLLLTPAPVRVVVASAPVSAAVTTDTPVASLAAPVPTLAPDLGDLAWVAIAVAAVLLVLRLGALAVRTVKLARLLGGATPANDDLRRQVQAIAADMGMRPPRTVTSPATPQALLSGLGHACLILPAAPASDTTMDAVIAHELAHLKRGDHRTLWLEEALAVLLAANPLIPVLRSRRDAAREEACDALALTRAGPAARRDYAQTLINALRDRAGPTGAGDTVVALTFTGAGRTTAMHRLKAVMTPATPAGRRTWIAAGLAGLAGTGLVVAASAALAGHRAPDVRVLPPVATAPQGPADEAARQATRAALAALPPEAADRYRGVSAAGYQTFCQSADDADKGFCAGVMFAHLAAAPGNGLCLPSSFRNDDAGLATFVARGKAEVARLAPRRDEGAPEYAERALKQAYPCRAATSATSEAVERLTVQVRQPERTPLILGSTDRLRLTLSSQGEDVRHASSMEMALAPDQPLERQAVFTLKDDQLPSLTRGRAYELTAEVVNAAGGVAYAAEPVTVRLAPGSRGRIADLRPELTVTRVAQQVAPATPTRAAPLTPTPPVTPAQSPDSSTTLSPGAPRSAAAWRANQPRGLSRSFGQNTTTSRYGPTQSLQPRIMARTQPGRRGPVY